MRHWSPWERGVVLDQPGSRRELIVVGGNNTDGKVFADGAACTPYPL